MQLNETAALRYAKIASDIAVAVFKKPPVTIEKLIALTTPNEGRREELRELVKQNRLKKTVYLTPTLTKRPIESPYKELYEVIFPKRPEMPFTTVGQTNGALRRLPQRKAKTNHSILSSHFQ